ncbi:MAG: hypothetical protein ABH871_01385 [Pseudomonadota bacterium]
MSPVLKLKDHDEEKERDFNIRHQMTLTTQERFEAMISFSIQLIKLAKRHGYRQTPKIIKRT